MLLQLLELLADTEEVKGFDDKADAAHDKHQPQRPAHLERLDEHFNEHDYGHDAPSEYPVQCALTLAQQLFLCIHNLDYCNWQQS